jgi:hypothetical protein
MQDRGRHGRLAPLRVRDAEHGDLDHVGMARGDLLDVLRVHLHAARIDHVLLAVDEVQEALLVRVAHVAGVQPAVPDRLRGEVRALAVAVHQERPAADDLADLAGRQVAPAFIHAAHLEVLRRHADGAGLAHRILAVEDRDEALGEAVELVEAVRQRGVQPALVLMEQRRAEGEDAGQRLEPARIEARCAEDLDDLRRHHHHVGDALALDQRHRALGVELPREHVGAAQPEARHHGDVGAVEDDDAEVSAP